MDRNRYIELDNAGTGLTPEEIEKGWHFCYDWDGMLVGPNTDEAISCGCDDKIAEWKVSEEGIKYIEDLERRMNDSWNSKQDPGF